MRANFDLFFSILGIVVFSTGKAMLILTLACVAGVRKGRGRELGRETTREGGGRRGTPARKPLFSPSRLLIKKNNKNNATVND